ncbi:hypothetical protein D9757_004111 [Collybiopsis confluens]|uniref:Uncharacterized protein n=1 Tax=Collybiopsis confluens TaxID=2823264 RepID=A0A8H5HUE9_9AGAR|nr:hypothetical protein D9757_004111 [Collybiopsis confluens]
MRFFALTALFGYTTLGMVSARPGPARLDQDIWTRAEADASSDCDGSAMKTCAIALVPTVAACGIAAAQAEIDIITDVACIGAAISLGTHFPSSCTACAKRFGSKVENVEQEISSKLPFHFLQEITGTEVRVIVVGGGRADALSG